MNQCEFVILDIHQEYLKFQYNQFVKLSPTQIEELFHQMFEEMVNDRVTFLTKLLVLPNYTRVFTSIPNQMVCYQLKELFSEIALELFFKIIDLGMFNTYNGNKVDFFLNKLNSHNAFLRRCF